MTVDLRKHHPFEDELRFARRMCALNVVLDCAALATFGYYGNADVSVWMGMVVALVLGVWYLVYFGKVIKQYPLKPSVMDWLIQRQVTRMARRQSPHESAE